MTDNEPIVKNVEGIQFSIMSPDEIRETSCVEITKNDTKGDKLGVRTDINGRKKYEFD